MKWLVKFHQEQKHCCPPGRYWIARKEIVETESADQARQQVLDAWRYNHKIEIKTVEEYKDDN